MTTATPRLDANVTILSAITGVRHDTNYGFSVGTNKNDAGKNTKSLTILVFAKYAGLTVEQTLPLFGEAWDEVRATPAGNDHLNIRELMLKGWSGVQIHGEHEGVSLREKLDALWENRANISPSSDDSVRKPIESAIDLLNRGICRVAFQLHGYGWYTDQAMKKAALLSFRINDNLVMRAGDLGFFDKVPTKFAAMSGNEMQAAGVRVVPPAVARYGSYVAKGAILMPSYVNIGAYVDENTMVDTWATVGSCAQIGKGVHLSGGVGIGGVLEPLQANPTIIEDGCFIGARSEVVEGVIVGEGSVLGMGVFLGQSTPVWDRQSRRWLDATYGLRIPPYSVVISGQKPARNPDDPTTYCAVIVKRVDAQTRAKTSINELLRD